MYINSLNSSPRFHTAPPINWCLVASLEHRNFQFAEKINRILQALQVKNLLALFLGEMISMLFYEVPSYHLGPCPLDATEEALR